MPPKLKPPKILIRTDDLHPEKMFFDEKNDPLTTITQPKHCLHEMNSNLLVKLKLIALLFK